MKPKEMNRIFCMIRALTLSSLAFAASLLVGCSLTDVPKVPDYKPLPMPDDAQPSPLKLGQFSIKIPRGSEVGAISPRFITCESPYGYLELQDIKEMLSREEIKDTFDDTLEGLGYDITGRSTLIYDEDIEDDEARTVYTVSGRVIDIKMDLCRKDRSTSLAGMVWGVEKTMAKGEGAVTIEWSVNDRLARKQVWKTVTRGYSNRKTSSTDGPTLVLLDAVSAAVHNLGSDPNFHNLIVNGQQPEKVLGEKERKPFRGKFDAAEAVAISNLPLSKTPVQPRLEEARKAAVLIRMGTGHGSGFFISREGHIVTNAHVTGDANRIAVVTADKKYTLYGEVLRRDKHRDVALIKLEEPPPEDAYEILPIRTEIPKVGEDLYAIGSPFLERMLQDTVTKGIMSAYRKQDPIRKVSYLQTDLFVTGGNSGGPILDVNGNIVGILVAGYSKDGQEMAGLNLAIPIGDALKKLDINGVSAN